MVLPNYPNKVVPSLVLVVLSSLFFIPLKAPAQTGSPLPGSSSPVAGKGVSRTAPGGSNGYGSSGYGSNGYVIPGGYGASSGAAASQGNGGSAGSAGRPSLGVPYSAPVPGPPPTLGVGSPGGGQAGTATSYERLPLNAGNAQSRLDELRNLMPHSRAKEFQEAIGEYCDWLQDMADAHWKLSQTFSKDGMKPQADVERQDCTKFGQLRRQAMLLKAQFLIAQRRYPEALGPLVDIVVAEPKTETGQAAYRLLREIGFSHDAIPASAVPAAIPAASVPAAGAGSGLTVRAGSGPAAGAGSVAGTRAGSGPAAGAGSGLNVRAASVPAAGAGSGLNVRAASVPGSGARSVSGPRAASVTAAGSRSLSTDRAASVPASFAAAHPLLGSKSERSATSNSATSKSIVSSRQQSTQPR